MAAPTAVVGTYAPNYAWVGPPAAYNGTGYTGGDSGMHIFLLFSPELHFRRSCNLAY